MRPTSLSKKGFIIIIVDIVPCELVLFFVGGGVLTELIAFHGLSISGEMCGFHC